MCLRIDSEKDEPFSSLGIAYFYDPNHYLGLAYFYLGEMNKAVERFYESLRLNIKNELMCVPAEVDWIWMAYMRMGNPADAKAVLDYVDSDTPMIRRGYIR